MPKKIGDKIETDFWNRLELKLKIGETELQLKGWQAALMRELTLNGAAMTIDGAHSFVLANGVFEIGSETVVEFIVEMQEKGWIKNQTEPLVKNPEKKRVLILSNLQPGKFLYQIIVHEEEK